MKSFRLPKFSRNKKEVQPGCPIRVIEAQGRDSGQRLEGVVSAEADAVDDTEPPTIGIYGLKVLYKPEEPKPVAE